MLEEQLAISPKKGVGSDDCDEPVSRPATEGRNFIIAIGIDDYALPAKPLKSCVTDCELLMETLKKNFLNFEIYDRPLYNRGATRANIRKAIRDFAASEFNAPENSLVLYYSGHGDVLQYGEGADTIRVGCWVPVDYSGDPEEEYLKFSDLLPLLANMKTLHVLVISDSCNAGSILDHHFLHAPSIGDLSKRDIGSEPSRWGLASSFGNGKSLAGSDGNPSVFTKALVGVLEQCTGPTLLSEISSRLEALFAQGKAQRVTSDRLNIKSSNSGQPIFYPKEEVAVIKKRKGILQKKLVSFNYDQQRIAIAETACESDQKLFAIYTGTPNCGLRHIAYQARRTLAEMQAIPGFRSVQPSLLYTFGEAGVLQLFNAAMDRSWFSVEQLKMGLVEILEQQNLVIELSFFQDGETGCTLSAAHKKMLLNDLGNFIANINIEQDEGNKIFLIVVDEEDCDYASLFDSPNIAGVKAVFMPRTNPKSLKSSAIVWYQKMKAEYTMPDEEIEFNRLFKDTVEEQLSTLIDNAKGYPGSFIREVCKAANCVEVAHQILYPNQ